MLQKKKESREMSNKLMLKMAKRKNKKDVTSRDRLDDRQQQKSVKSMSSSPSKPEGVLSKKSCLSNKSMLSVSFQKV